MEWLTTYVSTSKDARTLLTALVFKVPKLTRMFVPHIDTFPVKYTATVLSVDDLVGHCTRMGLVQSPSPSIVQPGVQNGTLTMAVQPSTLAVQSAASNGALSTNSTGTPVPAHRAMQDLMAATMTIQSFEGLPYSAFFDPSGEFDLSFDPSVTAENYEDRDRFDAFDLNDLANGTALGGQDLPFSFGDFVNEGSEYVDRV